ncbi:MAG: fatty acid desaturase family protein [Candidatus Anammoxibacter sp.]
MKNALLINKTNKTKDAKNCKSECNKYHKAPTGNHHGTVTFPNSIGFYDTLSKRVDQYFEEKRLSKTGDWRMFLKTGIIISLLLSSYIILVFYSTSILISLILCFILAQSFALLTINVMHDGGHESYAKNRLIRKLASISPDFCGLSSMLWRQRHNFLHHYYTNINGLDNDLQIVGGFYRLSPTQKWNRCHLFQHIYAFPLYSLLTLSWTIFSDFQKIISGKIGDYKIIKPTVYENGFLLFTKLFYFGYMIALPSLFHPFIQVITGFVGVHLVCGFTISIIFQLAHTTKSNTFPIPDKKTGIIEKEWAIHQVETTSNFAAKNKLACWYFGGLNFQIEHHLFPEICHVHYPALSSIVEKTCKQFNVLYVSKRTVFSAIADHYKFLKSLGKRPVEGYLLVNN